jgi:hypothetical protein
MAADSIGDGAAGRGWRAVGVVGELTRGTKVKIKTARRGGKRYLTPLAKSCICNANKATVAGSNMKLGLFAGKEIASGKMRTFAFLPVRFNYNLKKGDRSHDRTT